MADRHGRGDVLRLFESRGFTPAMENNTDQLVAAWALGASAQTKALSRDVPEELQAVRAEGGPLLCMFAEVNNAAGVRCLLNLGVSVDQRWPEGDPYFEEAKDSTALLVAAWRGSHDVVRLLLERGADVNAVDSQGRTAIQLAIRACTDSHWASRRKPDSVAALLAAGAVTRGIDRPTGYAAIDALLTGSSL